MARTSQWQQIEARLEELERQINPALVEDDPTSLDQGVDIGLTLKDLVMEHPLGPAILMALHKKGPSSMYIGFEVLEVMVRIPVDRAYTRKIFQFAKVYRLTPSWRFFLNHIKAHPNQWPLRRHNNNAIQIPPGYPAPASYPHPTDQNYSP